VGGATCNLIIKADLKAFFETPEIYAEISETQVWKTKVDEVLAKDYASWDDRDFFTLHNLWAELYLKLRREYG